MKCKEQFEITLIILLFFLIIIGCKEKEIPVLSTSEITKITAFSAMSGGTIANEGSSTVFVRGVCWSANQNPTINDKITLDGTGNGTFESSLTGLTPSTTYYVRAYAINEIGTSYGNEISFKTMEPVIDIDGNLYSYVIIGTQTWLAENLKTTKYDDGTPIPLVYDNYSWFVLTTPGYCWYETDRDTYKSIYGALYNWYAASSGRLCPAGWHVPTDTDWQILTNYLGGESIAGGKLKETGITHWQSPNTGATNETGFTALPGGYRRNNGLFETIGFGGGWWTSSGKIDKQSDGWGRGMGSAHNTVVRFNDYKQNGMSIRCIKD